MSAAIKCNGCGKFGEMIDHYERPEGWLHVERSGLWITVSERRELDFCSASCIGQFFTTEAIKKAQMHEIKAVG